MKISLLAIGMGGQGIVTIGDVLTNTAKELDLNLTRRVNYGIQMRGGFASTEVIISDKEIRSPIVDEFDWILVMDKKVFIDNKPNGKVILSAVDNDSNYFIPAISIAKEKKLRANMILLGYFLKISGLFSLEQIEKGISQVFSGKKEIFLDENIRSLVEGFNYEG